GSNGAVAQALRVVEPAEQEAGSTQPAIGPTAIGDVSPRLVTLEELLAFLEPNQRLGRRAELRQCPSGVGNRERKHEDDVPAPKQRDPAFDQETRFPPVSLEEVELTRGEVGLTDGERTGCVILGEPDHLGFMLDRLGESAELGETRDQPKAIE